MRKANLCLAIDHMNLSGRCKPPPPFPRSNFFFNFMAKSHVGAPRWLAPPTTENPGSAPESDTNIGDSHL